MKIDRSKVRKANSDVPSDCQKIIQHLKDCSEPELLAELKQIDVWFFGKCELYHWIDVLDRFDDILSQIASPVPGKKWVFEYDCLDEKLDAADVHVKRELVHQILKFTALLIEHSYARHLYNSAEICLCIGISHFRTSVDYMRVLSSISSTILRHLALKARGTMLNPACDHHLINLLDCGDGSIVLSVLNLVYVFSKRSNYLSRIGNDKRKALQDRLFHLGESWGGSGGKYTLDLCCSNRSSVDKLYKNVGNLYFEYYKEMKVEESGYPHKDGLTINQLCSIQVNNLRELSPNPGEIMENLMQTHDVPEDVKISLFYRLRLSHAIFSEENCLQFVQARLQAISILIYSNATDLINPLIYDGLIEEIVNTLELSDSTGRLAEVKACCLKTLTAIIHLDRNPRLSTVIENTGAASYHGFLPTLVRQCISHMTSSNFSDFPQPYATALFSFLYHLASYELGCEALVSCGLMESLLKVVQWQGGDDHITFVTRAVRVIDLITNLDMASFQTHNGLNILTRRLEGEVKICKQFHGQILDVSEAVQEGTASEDPQDLPAVEGTSQGSADGSADIAMKPAVSSPVEVDMQESSPSGSTPPLQNQCLPQRAALLKSILNFLKKAIPDPAFADATRSLMDESLQTSLKYIISNAEYYGALLFLLATDVVTVYIFHEPSMLSTLQDSGLTAIVLKALVVKDVPATRENLASLPNTLSALCLNNRGLNAFVACKPFERLFRILISPEYLPAMKRRRSSDPQGDTAMHLGSAMDELMRHQPTLKSSAMKAIIKLIDELVELGHDPSLIAFHPSDKSLPTNKQAESPLVSAGSTEEPLSDEDMEEDFRAMVNRRAEGKSMSSDLQKVGGVKRTFIPLSEYLLNVTKFLENILCNNGTDDHCSEFVRHGGLSSLMKLFSLPNLPVEFPLLPACQSVSSVCKSIVVLSQENRVLKEGLTQLDALLDQLDPLCNPKQVKGSVLLHELANNEKPGIAMHDSKQSPLLHAMAATDAFVNMFVQICRGSQSNIRSMSVNKWSSDLGIKVLKKLSALYTRLVWESSVLLTLCNPVSDTNPSLQFAADDLRQLIPNPDGKDVEMRRDEQESDKADKTSGLTAQRQRQLKLIRWLLASSSHLGRALAELFGLLVHQCVGSPRTRRHLHNVNPLTAPTFSARLIASQLIKLLVQGLSWKCPPEITVPRIRTTFYICAVGFAGPIFFDDKKNPYHILLQQFRLSGGLEHLKDLFDRMLKQYEEYKSTQDSNKKYSADIAEFLDAWLSLVEKMVNTKVVLESPHALPTQASSPGFVPFNPIEFLVKVHTLAFHAMQSLWHLDIVKHNSGQIATKMLNILCHILKGETILKEEQQKASENRAKAVPPKSKPEPHSSYAAPQVRNTEPDVSAVYMQQLMDMGFSREHVREGLLHSGNNLEQAMDYVLSTPPPPGNQARETGMDVDASEEDMMIRAIALSLGENLMSQEEPQESQPEKKEVALEECIAQSKEALDKFTAGMFQLCLKLQDDVPSTVFGIHDLLIVACNRNGREWRNNALQGLSQQMFISAKALLAVVTDPTENKDLLTKMCYSSEGVALANRLHLFVLMAQDLPHCSAVYFQKLMMSPHLMHLMELCLSEMNKAKASSEPPTTPRWLALVILLLDQYQKTAASWQRKKTQECSHVWKWFDDRSGRWCNYSISNNTSIDNAYHAGDASVRFTAGRRHYIVLFRVMVQINEDTGNRRPIMLHVTSKPPTESEAKEEGGEKKSTEKVTKSGKARKRSASAVSTPSAGSSKDGFTDDLDEHYVHVDGLDSHEIESIVRICTQLIAIPADPNTLNSALRILLRLTRDFNMAALFTERGGPAALLQLTEKSFFNGFYPIVTLLIRHAMEDFKMLKHTLEKVIVSTVTHGHGNITCGVGQSSIGARELHYILRTLTPACCRSPELFSETFKKLVRIQLPSQLRRGQGDDQELSIPPNSPQITKIDQTSKSIGCPLQHPVMESIVTALLDSLVELYYKEFLVFKVKEVVKGPETKKTESENDYDNGIDFSSNMWQQQATLIRRLTGEATNDPPSGSVQSVARLLAAVGDDISTIISGNNSQSSSSGNSSKDNTSKDQSASTSTSTNPDKRLLSLQTLLKLLAELVKTYSPAAKLVCKHLYPPADDEVAKKFQGPALAFIMDYLLPEVSETDGSSISSLARALLAVISSCSQVNGVQAIVVTELKSSLMRTLQLPESKEKHSRLQALFNLIVTIIETSSPQSLGRAQITQGSNIVKLLIKRGIVIDLARATHSLDLSSPSLVGTVNSMLKPLEKLSNMAAHQAYGGKGDSKDGTKEGTDDAGQGETTEAQSNIADGSASPSVPRDNSGRAGPQELPHGDTSLIPAESQETPQEENLSSSSNINDLESIVQRMLRPQNGGPRILSETIETASGSAVVEGSILIERHVEEDSESGSSSDSSSDDISDGMSDGRDEDSSEEEAAEGDDGNDSAGEEVQSDDEEDEEAHHDRHDESEMVMINFGGLESSMNESGLGNDSQAADGDAEQDRAQEEVVDLNEDIDADETFVLDDEEDDGDADDENDEQEEGNDEGGSDMDGDDNMDVMEDTVVFEDEEFDPFTGDDDAGTSFEISFPRRPYAIHFPIPRILEEEAQGGANGRAGVFQHPLLSQPQNTDNTPSTSTGGQRFSRTRTGLHTERSRHHPNHTVHTFHVHSQGSNVARLLVGDDVRFVSRNADGGFTDDLFIDVLGDNNDGVSSPQHSVPNALSRWNIESKLLDGMSSHECVNILKPDIVEALEKLQEKELAEKKESEAKAQKEKKSKTEKTDTTVTSGASTSSVNVSTVNIVSGAGSASFQIDPRPIVGLPVATEGGEQQLQMPERMDADPSDSIQTDRSSRSDNVLASTNIEIDLLQPSNLNSNPEMNSLQPILGTELPAYSAQNTLQPRPIVSSGVTSMETSVIVSAGSLERLQSPTIMEVSPPSQAQDQTQLIHGSTSGVGSGTGQSYSAPVNQGDTATLANPSGDVTLAGIEQGSRDGAQTFSNEQERNTSFFSLGQGQRIQAAALAADLAAAIISQLSTTAATPVTSAALTSTTTVHPSEVDASGQPRPIEHFPTSVAVQCGETQGQDAQQQPINYAPTSQALTGLTTLGQGTDQQVSQLVTFSSSNQPSTSGQQPNQGSEVDGLTIPEGVDPSFLAALPDSIREEVLRDHCGIRPRSTEPTTRTTTTSAPMEVSAEFLAALPPEVQEEVLEQQRLEQARFLAQQQPPDQPVDPAAFIRNLPHDLRRQILADVDDTVLAVLPPDLSTEAQGLRREVEQRQQYIHQRIPPSRSGDPASVLSQLIRNSGFPSQRVGGGNVHLTQLARLFPSGHSGWGIRSNVPDNSNKKIAGRQLLDYESLACLLILIFIDEPKLNTSRLHRVLRNLCYHSGTKMWIIQALISILKRTSGVHECGPCRLRPYAQDESSAGRWHMQGSGFKHSKKQRTYSTPLDCYCEELRSDVSDNDRSDKTNSHWLSRSLDSSLGHRVNLFEFSTKSRGFGEGKYSEGRTQTVGIHPQASSFVCKHTLDALSFLAKNFASSFCPYGTKNRQLEKEHQKSLMVEDKDSGHDFWDILGLLDLALSKKGKLPLRMPKDISEVSDDAYTFDNSPLGQILSMLSHPVIRRNTSLTDKLLRLLSVVSLSLPELPKNDIEKEKASDMRSANAVLPSESTLTSSHDEIRRVPSDSDNVLHSHVSEAPAPYHTVTFADFDTVVGGTAESSSMQQPTGVTGGGLPGDDVEPSNIALSETLSVASSLVVEGSIEGSEALHSGIRSPRAESVLSVYSDGTVAHSDISAPTTEGHVEPMDIEHVSHPTSDTSSTGTRSSPVPIPGLLGPEKDPIVMETQLRLAVSVLTSGTCSEDGLEDATTLLLQLSRIDPRTRDSILALLMEGARELAYSLCEEIKDLYTELKAYNIAHAHNRNTTTTSTKGKHPVAHTTVARSQPWRGRGRASFGANRRVTSALSGLQRSFIPKPIIYDLHLPSMAALTGKKSSQNLLLRVLKVIIQLREAAKKSASKSTAAKSSDSQSRGMRLIERLNTNRGSLSEVVAALEADVEAMYEMIDRFGGRRRRQQTQACRHGQGTQGTQGAESSEQETATASDAQGDATQSSEAAQPDASQTEREGSSAQQDDAVPGTSSREPLPLTSDQSDVALLLFPRLSTQLILDELWDVLGECLTELGETSDANAVLVLQPAVEAFFLVHGSEKDDTKDKNSSSKPQLQSQMSISSCEVPQSPGPLSPGGAGMSPPRLGSTSSITSDLPPDTQKFLKFAETHRLVLNQILRQSTTPLGEGPFAVLVNHTRLLDFDVKRRYFRQELEKMDKGVRREDMPVHVRREHNFEDSYRELHRKSPEEMKNRLYIVFDGEEGQDAGGLLREWYQIIAREMFNPNYALFSTSQGEKATYLPNRNSHCNPNHLSYFKFVGRIVAKAIYDNKLIDCYFTRSFYKHILGKPVHFTDMEAEDYSFYQGLVYLLEHDINDLGYELTFSVEVPVFGLNEIHDLKPNGQNIPVAEETKREYVKYVCQEKMTGSIRQQIDSFLGGFYEIIPKRLISIFDEQELELLIAGLPTIDIEDLRANAEYHKYDVNSLQILWFWRALRSFDQADRAKFLQFVTGTSKVPLQGFSALEGMNGPQKFQIHRDDRSTDRLPSAHTCFNQLDLPAYETFDKLNAQLLKAIHECPEGFGLA